MTNHIARDHTIGDDTVAENEGSGNVEFGGTGCDYNSEDLGDEPPSSQDDELANVLHGRHSEDDKLVDDVLIPCVGGELLEKRPELLRLLQYDAGAIEDKRESDDEAIDLLAEGLEDGEADCNLAADGDADVAADGAADGNARLPLSYFTQCLEGEFTQLYFMQEHNDPNGGIIV